MNEKEKSKWAVAYNLQTKEIKGIKEPDGEVFPSSDCELHYCDTKQELEDFITENNLKQPRQSYGYSK